MSNEVIEWAKHHPVPTALGVVVIIGGLWLLSGSGGSSSADSGNAAYFAAQSNQSNNSAAIQIAQIGANATTAQTGILADSKIADDTLWANTDVTLNTANHDIALANANAGAIGAIAGSLAASDQARYGVSSQIASEFPQVGKFGKQQLNIALAANNNSGNSDLTHALTTYLNGLIAAH